MNCIIVSTFSLLMLFVWISQINLAVAMIDGVVEKYLNYIRLADDELARDPSSVGAMSDKAWALQFGKL